MSASVTLSPGREAPQNKRAQALSLLRRLDGQLLADVFRDEDLQRHLGLDCRRRVTGDVASPVPRQAGDSRGCAGSGASALAVAGGAERRRAPSFLLVMPPPIGL